jgi:uncharacterized protein YifE (UPF0438 family)
MQLVFFDSAENPAIVFVSCRTLGDDMDDEKPVLEQATDAMSTAAIATKEAVSTAVKKVRKTARGAKNAVKKAMKAAKKTAKKAAKKKKAKAKR